MSKTILIAEDEKASLFALKSILELNHYRVITAANGKEGLEAALQNDIDLIITDIMMPEMSGIEFCQRLRKYPKGQHIPFIFMTAKSDEKTVSEGFEAGAEDYIVKPYRTKELLLRIQKTLRQTTAKEKSSDIVLTGTISDISMLEILRFCEDRRLDGIIELYNDDRNEGKIYLKDGEIKTIEYNKQINDSALDILLAWESGTFVVRQNEFVFKAPEAFKINSEPKYHLLIIHHSSFEDGNISNVFALDHQVYKASAASEALQLLETQHSMGNTIDALIISIHYIKEYGLQLLIQAKGRYPNLNIIIGIDNYISDLDAEIQTLFIQKGTLHFIELLTHKDQLRIKLHSILSHTVQDQLITIADILQLCAMSGHTLALSIHHKKDEAIVYFENKHIVAILVNQKYDKNGFNIIADWNEGQFLIQYGAVYTPIQIETPSTPAVAALSAEQHAQLNTIMLDIKDISESIQTIALYSHHTLLLIITDISDDQFFLNALKEIDLFYQHILQAKKFEFITENVFSGSDTFMFVQYIDDCTFIAVHAMADVNLGLIRWGLQDVIEQIKTILS